MRSLLITTLISTELKLLDNFYIYNINSNEFNQTFSKQLYEESSVVSIFVWFEVSDNNCTAYNISQASQDIGVEIVLGVE